MGIKQFKETVNRSFLQDKQLLNPNQPGFRQSDSCMKQLLSITHKIFQSFDATPPIEVRSVFFLDISKAFFYVDSALVVYILYVKLKCSSLFPAKMQQRIRPFSVLKSTNM